jgi:hypothetical protein
MKEQRIDEGEGLGIRISNFVLLVPSKAAIAAVRTGMGLKEFRDVSN